MSTISVDSGLQPIHDRLKGHLKKTNLITKSGFGYQPVRTTKYETHVVHGRHLCMGMIARISGPHQRPYQLQRSTEDNVICSLLNRLIEGFEIKT